jgi:Arc/MetJ-type ribon-helix-helix transcriptional regulator
VLCLVARIVVKKMAARQKISISIDSDLLTFIDRHATNRSEVINEALKKWRNEKLQAEIDNAYARSSRAMEPELDEENWLLNDTALMVENID